MLEDLILTVLMTSVPLVYAATGELVVERSGVLNLGVEGMMLMGAVAAFGVAMVSGSLVLGVMAGAIAGMLTASLFGILVLGFATNQVATGLALTIFGTGLSGLAGAPLIGKAIEGLPQISLPVLSDLPLVGKLVFSHALLAYGAVAVVAGEIRNAGIQVIALRTDLASKRREIEAFPEAVTAPIDGARPGGG